MSSHVHRKSKTLLSLLGRLRVAAAALAVLGMLSAHGPLAAVHACHDGYSHALRAVGSTPHTLNRTNWRSADRAAVDEAAGDPGSCPLCRSTWEHRLLPAGVAVDAPLFVVSRSLAPTSAASPDLHLRGSSSPRAPPLPA
jgi:hypothetical protein